MFRVIGLGVVRFRLGDLETYLGLLGCLVSQQMFWLVQKMALQGVQGAQVHAGSRAS